MKQGLKQTGPKAIITTTTAEEAAAVAAAFAETDAPNPGNK